MGFFLDSLARLIDSNFWAATLVDTTLKGVVILLVSAGLVRLFKPTSASIRHLIRSLALLAVILVPVCRLLVPPWEVAILPASPWSAPEPVSVSSGAPDPIESPGMAARPTPPPVPIDPVTAEPASASAISQFRLPITLPNNWVTRWQMFVLLLWAAGGAYFLLRLLLGMVSVHEAIRRAWPVEAEGWENLATQASRRLNLRRPVRLLVSPGLEVALSVGLLRPTVLLPSVALTWSESRRRSILLHEFSHAKRWDNLTNLIAQLACALHWFNPMVWATVRRLTIDRERACDDEVLATGTRPSDYAGHLLEIARAISSRRLWGRLEVSQSSALKDRLQAVLSTGVNRRRPSLALCLTGVALASGALVPLAAFQPWIDAAAFDEAGPLGTGFESSLDKMRRLSRVDPQNQETAGTVQSDSSHAAVAVRSDERRSREFRSLLSLTRPEFSPDGARVQAVLTTGRGWETGSEAIDRWQRFSVAPTPEITRQSIPVRNLDSGNRPIIPRVFRRTPDPGGGPNPPGDPGPVEAEVARVDLGTLGGDASRALAINDLGFVVGESRKQSNLVNPFLWTARSGMIDLGNPLNTHTRAVKVNQAGHVLCETFNSNVFRGMVWTTTAGLVDIGSLDSRAPFTQVRAINQEGLVVGASRDKTGHLRAFVWSAASGMLDLGIPGDSEALAINDLGQVAGYTEEAFSTGVQTRAFFWDPVEGLRFIRTEGAPLSIATALNNNGQVVGYAEFEDGYPHAFLWSRDAGLVNLGMVGSDFPISLATAINDLGQVVGQSVSVAEPDQPQRVRAFRWTPAGGIKDIGVSSDDSPLAINAIGQIVGAYLEDSVDDRPSAILWTEAGQVELQDSNSTVIALNNRNQAVGSSLANDQQRHAFLWEVRLKSAATPQQ